MPTPPWPGCSPPVPCCGRRWQDVGDGIRTAAVTEPGGSILGVIENPHFKLKP